MSRKTPHIFPWKLPPQTAVFLCMVDKSPQMGYYGGEVTSMTDYTLLIQQLAALSEGVTSPVTLTANAAALLYAALPDLNWAGFYRREGEELILWPFQGQTACVRIPRGRGVCGAALAADATRRVEDVHAFPGHIACDAASRSEIVVPLHKEGEVWGVLDLDSPLPGRFTPEDQRGLEEFAKELEKRL